MVVRYANVTRLCVFLPLSPPAPLLCNVSTVQLGLKYNDALVTLNAVKEKGNRDEDSYDMVRDKLVPRCEYIYCKVVDFVLVFVCAPVRFARRFLCDYNDRDQSEFVK